MAATYKIYVDFDNDGSFSTIGDDITEYIISVTTDIGMPPFSTIARQGSMMLELNNQDKRFSPSNTASPYYDAVNGETKLLPRRPVRLTIDIGGGENALFTGVIDQISIAGGQYGERRASIRCSDKWQFLRRRRLGDLTLQTDKRSDQVLTSVLSLIGSQFSDTSQIRTGKETFAYTGDTWWIEDMSVEQAIKDVVGSEGWPSRGFINGAGQFVFWDREYLQTLVATAASTAWGDSDMHALDYMFGDKIYNKIIISMKPREEGIAGTTLWTNQNEALRLVDGTTRSVRALFSDTGGNRIGASAVTTPVLGTDYTLNTEEDGSGINVTTGVSLSITKRSESADIEFTNSYGATVFVRNLKVRGTPLKHFDPNEISKGDTASQAKYGVLDVTVNAPLLNDVDFGNQLASFMLSLLSTPRPHLRATIKNGTATQLGHIANRSIGDLIAFTETQTALSSDNFLIIGVTHTIQNAGKEHITVFTLEPVRSFAVWLLGQAGYSELGQTTYLGL